MSPSPDETVIVRDRDGMRRLQSVDAWASMTLVAALSADPRSFDELARAWLRYRPEEPLEHMPWVDGEEEPTGNPWVLIDLACLRIVAGAGAELPDDRAAYQPDEGDRQAGSPLVWINLPPNWQCEVGAQWQSAVRPLPVPSEPLDVRGILYGRALAKGIASRTLDMARSEALPLQRVFWSDLETDEAPSESQRKTASQWHALSVRVHADWLMTPREDLGGEPPRCFLHRGRDWVEQELHNRQMQWSRAGQAPRPLDRDTFAYRHNPLGRHEVVMYFDLCRELVDKAWNQIFQTPEIDQAALTQVLHQYAQRWMEEGSIDGEPTPPAVIIETERRLMPLVGGGSHVDCDCPLCRMEMEAEEGVGPMFCGFDGHHLELDDEFAFSLCVTREEWEMEQAQFREVSESMEQDEPLGSEADPDDPFASVWTRSYTNDELVREAGPSSPLAVMALAVRMSELINDLKTTHASRDLIEGLNHAFDAYRAAENDPVLLDVATVPLVDVLEQIAEAHPHLTSKAADVQSQLDQRRRG